MVPRGLRTSGSVKQATLALLVVVSTALSAVPAFAGSQSFADVVERLLPSVVNISTARRSLARKERDQNSTEIPRGSPLEKYYRKFLERQQQRSATPGGSGFVIDPASLIATNNHVVAEADEITVTLHDGSKLSAKIVGRDKRTDIALLKVEPKKPLAALSFGNSDGARVGDRILAIGNPFGLGTTVTAGIVSARQRDINAGPYDDFIQTDASINQGDAGGPMVNLRGEVVGINTSIFAPSGGSVGIGFAIPSNMARPILDQLKEFGRVRRGWLGVRLQAVTEEIAQGLGLDEATGALIADVTEGGPAANGEARAGDVITKFDGKPVVKMRRLPRIVAETPVGKDVEVEIWRNGTKLTLSVTLGEFPEAPQAIAAKPRSERALRVAALGLLLSLSTPELRRRFDLSDEVQGVIVIEVEDGSAAAERGIKAGDIIRKIGPNQTRVVSPAQVKAEIDKAVEAKRKSILMLVESDKVHHFVAVRVETD